jgi:hypothetical protein
VSSKLNQVYIDGELHNPFGVLSAAGVVNGHDELTKRQVFLPAIGFHDTRLGPIAARALWGVYPMPDLMHPANTAGWPGLPTSNIDDGNQKHSTPNVQHPMDRHRKTWGFGVEC